MLKRGRPETKIAIPIKLVMLLQDLDFGGTQRYAVNLLKNLDRKLFDVKLWVLRGGTDMVSAMAESVADCIWLSQSSWVGPTALSNLALRLARYRPDILYTMTVVPNIWGRMFGTVTKIPVIVSSWRDLYPKQYESWMWPLSTRIITNSRTLKRVMAPKYGVDPLRVSVVPNGVDVDFFSPDPSCKATEPTVLFVGRLAKEKDPFTLLEAFRLTVQRIPNARLDILGNGRLRDKLQLFVRRQRLENKVRLLPGTTDIRPMLKRSWVLAMTSIREASPNVILEAMATELPVVGTRVGGIPELVKDGDTGLIVEPRDPKSVSDALCRLLENESERQVMGRSARKRVLTNHSTEQMVRETEQVLLETIIEKVEFPQVVLERCR